MAKKTYQSGDETKEKILKASKNLFYEKGFEGTLYDDICRITHVNRALIPYHFKNKADLALAAYDSFIDEYVATRNEIAEGYPNEVKLIIGILYYYRLLADEHVARFVDYIVGENTYRERLLLGESIMYRNIIPEGQKIPAKQWDSIIHLVWGMEVETIRMISRGQYSDITQVGKIMIQMLFQYFGYERAKVNQMYGRVNRILNRYHFVVTPDFTIEVTKIK
ncbi:MAG: TetR/AcrR family transcriptional regulator [Lachnospiraceae bacterium]|nr:TetR/AcrR family transcriptional regulator [Lachnospiraceae bacterium]